MRGRRWPQKPPVGVPIDPTSIFGGNLVAFYPLTQGNGTPNDIVTHLAPALTTGASWSNATMPGLLCSGNGAGAAAIIPTPYQYPLPATIAVAGRLLGQANFSATTAFGVLQTNSTSARNWSIDITGVSGTSSDIELVYGGTNTLGSTAWTVGIDFVASASLVSGAQAFYINGLQKGTSATSFSATWGSTSSIALGAAQSFFSARNPNVMLYWAVWWNAYQSAAWHAALGASVRSICSLWAPLTPAWWMGGAAPTSATLTHTAAGDSFGGSAGFQSAATLAASAGYDALAAAAGFRAAGGLAAAPGPDVLAAPATVTHLGGLAATSAPDVFAAIATFRATAAAGLSELRDLFGGTATVTARASLAATGAGDVLFAGGLATSGAVMAPVAGPDVFAGSAAAAYVAPVFVGEYVDPDAASLIELMAADPSMAEVDWDAAGLIELSAADAGMAEVDWDAASLIP